MCDPISVIGAGAGLLGNMFASNAASDAASSAAAAQQGAIKEALQYAQAGYLANQGTIAGTGGLSQQALNAGYGGALEALSPVATAGDQARDYYARAAGLQGEDARSNYVGQLMARPEYQAANKYATSQVQQQMGNRQGSGALARALQNRQTQFAQSYINNDMQKVEPLMKSGDQARALQAANAQQQGTNSAANTWKTGNAFINNQNALTNDYMQGALGRGNVSANLAATQGQIDQNAFSNIGNAVGRLLGGVNGVNNFSAFS